MITMIKVPFKMLKDDYGKLRYQTKRRKKKITVNDIGAILKNKD